MIVDKIYQGDCRELFKQLPNNSIDLIVTSPPYNVGIKYDEWDDTMPWENYVQFTKEWLNESARVLRVDGGRIAINILCEVNYMDRGGRKMMMGEYYQMLKECGFKFAGYIELDEDYPHMVKYTAWGSWLSPSAPYIHNAKECIIIAYPHEWKKQTIGQSYFDDSAEKKTEFIELCKAIWPYINETRKLTEANFSPSIPENVMKILTWQDDIVLDPFMGSGTTAIAAKKLKRHYIGFEISENYAKIATERVNNLTEELEMF